MNRDSATLPYLRHGLLAGALGGSVVATFFLVIDLLAGRPLATPTALGAALFLGGAVDLSRPPEAVLILGYTAVHGAVFVALAAITASLLLNARRLPGTAGGRTAILAGCLFAGSTSVLFLFTALGSLPRVWIELGVWRVLAANLLSAVAMAVPLARLRPSRRRDASLSRAGETRREPGSRGHRPAPRRARAPRGRAARG